MISSFRQYWHSLLEAHDFHHPVDHCDFHHHPDDHLLHENLFAPEEEAILPLSAESSLDCLASWMDQDVSEVLLLPVCLCLDLLCLVLLCLDHFEILLPVCWVVLCWARFGCLVAAGRCRLYFEHHYLLRYRRLMIALRKTKAYNTKKV